MPSTRRNPFLVAVFALLVALASALGATSAYASKPSTSTTTVDLAASVQGMAVPTGTSSAPFVVKGTPFDVTVSFLDASGNPTVLPSGVTSLQLNDSLGDALGTVTNIPSTAQSVTFQGVSIATAANGVTVSASATTGNKKSTNPVASDPFDVLVTFASTPQNTPLSQIGGTSSTAGCLATPSDPVCADLLLPSGSDTSILMSLGVCGGLGKCLGADSQALVGLSQYTKSSPATMIVKCDKTLCGGGGINKQKLAVEPSTGGGFAEAPACPAKNTIALDQWACVDYVQSTRDNAGDTFLYLLFTNDVRAHYT